MTFHPLPSRMDHKVAYLQRHQIPELIDGLVQRLVEQAPANPVQFLVSQLLARESKYTVVEQAPALAPYRTLAATLVRQDVYCRLCDKRTSLGVTLDDCMRDGADHRSLPVLCPGAVVSTGFLLGDAECTVVFRDIFEALLAARCAAASLNVRALSNYQMDVAFQKVRGGFELRDTFVQVVCVRLRRNLSGFRFPPSISRAERRAIDKLFRSVTSNAIATMRQAGGGAAGGAKGTTTRGGDHNVAGGSATSASASNLAGRHISTIAFPPTLDNAPNPRRARELMPMPMSEGSPACRHSSSDWPDARSSFLTHDHTSAIHGNTTNDHFLFAALAPPGTHSVRAAAERCFELERLLQEGLLREKHDFASDASYGVLTADIEYLGAGMSVDVEMNLPLKFTQSNGFAELLKRCHLRLRHPHRNSFWSHGDEGAVDSTASSSLDGIISSATAMAVAPPPAGTMHTVASTVVPFDGSSSRTPPMGMSTSYPLAEPWEVVSLRTVTNVGMSPVAVLQAFIDGVELLMDQASHSLATAAASSSSAAPVATAAH